MRKFIIRLFLFLFIIAILNWIVPITFSAFNLESSKLISKLPPEIKNLGWLIPEKTLTLPFQLPYYLIALGLLIEFFNPRIILRWHYNKFLTIIALVLIINAAAALIYKAFFTEFFQEFYDSMFYGLGLGVLFLLQLNAASLGMRLILWTRLIEVWGLVIGYTLIPITLGYYTSGVFGHYYENDLGAMLFNPWFWNDLITHSFSLIAVIYILWKSGSRPLWIFFFSASALVIGFLYTHLLPTIFQTWVKSLG